MDSTDLIKQTDRLFWGMALYSAVLGLFIGSFFVGFVAGGGALTIAARFGMAVTFLFVVYEVGKLIRKLRGSRVK